MAKSGNTINRVWHEKNRMPVKANFQQRVQWHLEHQKHCTCRPIPAKLAAEMKKKGIQY
ncbi:MAG: hypothetical protein KF862_05670 [Chitinophagaceae bacterium]|nr:hypothetical protein [Chitinophagaceae bacterium]